MNKVGEINFKLDMKDSQHVEALEVIILLHLTTQD